MTVAEKQFYENKKKAESKPSKNKIRKSGNKIGTKAKFQEKEKYTLKNIPVGGKKK